MAHMTLRAPWLPAGGGEFLRRRASEIAGAVLVRLAAVPAPALGSYAPADPAPSHAVDGPVRNIAGTWGASVADVALQTIGLAAALPALALFAWGFRLMRAHRLPLWPLRVALLPAAIALAAMALAFLPVPPDAPRALAMGMGGIVGGLFLQWIAPTTLALGLEAPGLAALAGALAALAFGFLMAVTWVEWRALGRFLAALGRGIGRVARAGWSLRRKVGDPKLARAEEKAERRRERLEPMIDGDSAPRIERAEVDLGPRPDPEELVEAPAREAPAKPKRAPAAKRQQSLDLRDGSYRLPGLELLRVPRPEDRVSGVDEAALAQNARLLEAALDDFGVQGRIVKVRPGPVVTLYELEPAPGTRAARVIGLADDIARSMSAVAVRVAVVPGRNAIGIELPNHGRETVYLRELLADSASDLGPQALALALGKDIGGTPVVGDLARMPHLLIAGTTGSGKSVAINTMILSLLYRHAPADCRFIMIDPKMIELSVYDGIPHLLAPVVTDPKKAVVALKWVVREMEERYKRMSKLGVRDIKGYNSRILHAEAKGEVLTQIGRASCRER